MALFVKQKGKLREVTGVSAKKDGTIRTVSAWYIKTKAGMRVIWEAALRLWKGSQIFKSSETWKY